MRAAHLLFIATTLFVPCSVSCRHKPRDVAKQKTESSVQARIARGAHLATVSGCSDCHTPGGMYGAPDGTRLLSGSELGWRGPWGTSYPPNLTPDVETGLGAWSEDEIVRAIRNGLRRDGHPLQPPMPWPSYALMTDDEAYAIAAFLKSLPAVKHRAPSRVPPDVEPTGAVVTIPPPPPWDAPRSKGVGGGPAPRASEEAE